jgi:hypothetical protein
LPAVVFVAQAASREDDEQRHRPRADRKRQKSVHDGGDKELTYKKRVNGRVRQDGDKHAAFRVVEEPRIDEGQGDARQQIPNEVGATAPRCTPLRNPEVGQVPKDVEGPEDEAPDQRTV